MALISRINRLFQADVNALLDRIEEPDVLLKQALREMQEAINAEQARLAELRKKSLRLEAMMSESAGKIEKVDSEIDLCFEQNELELAKQQVKKKLELQQLHEKQKCQLAEVEDEVEMLSKRIEDNTGRMSAMQQKYELGKEAVAEKTESALTMTDGISETEIEIAFLAEKQKRAVS